MDILFFYKWTRKEHMKIINFFLNGVIYFLLHQLIQFHILYKKNINLLIFNNR